MFRFFLCALVVSFITENSVAEVNLNESPLWMRARVVPPGQQLWGFRVTSRQATQRFDSRGMVQPLGQAYAHTLTWKQLLQADPSTQEAVRGYMRDNHVNDDDVAATETYEIRRSEVGLLADWAYGLTRRWTIGVQVPITYRQTTAASKVELTPVLAQARHQPSQRKTILGLSAQDLRVRLAALADRQLNANGYDSVPGQRTDWIWGDINLLSRTEVLETYHWVWALQPNVRLPTSRNPVVSDYVQWNNDEGQCDVGLTSLLDLRLHRWVSGLRFGYVVQLPDSVRVLTPSQRQVGESTVRRDLGDYVWASVDGQIRVTRSLGLSGGHSYLKKAQDRYSGSAVDGVDYGAMGAGTEQELHQSWIGMQYQIGRGGDRDGIENKWLVSVAYNHPWIGRNATQSDQASLGLISYF